MTILFQKSAVAELDYTFDWRLCLTGEELITASQWILPEALTLQSSSYTDTTATGYISGGTAGQAYTVRNRVTTDSSPPKIDQRSFQLYIAER